MDPYFVTTSFGRRPATLGQISAQRAVSRAIAEAALPGSNAAAAVNKWHVFRTLTEIRERLGVSDRSLGVLNALLSFHPETALSLPKPPREDEPAADDKPSCELIVFPSNKALAARAHGMASMTLWRHLTALVEAGLIVRRDSPNGKRYARKDISGQGEGQRFSEAFGFDLTPLVARAGEFEALAEMVKAEQKRRYLMKERISLLRRDVSKLIGLGLDEGLPGDWEALRAEAMALMTPLRRIRSDAPLAALEAALARLRADATKLMETHLNEHETMSNAHRSDAHQYNSNPECHTDLEPASKEEGGGEGARSGGPGSANSAPGETLGETLGETSGGGAVEPPCPLGLVMEACPDVRDYAPGGRVRGWPDFLRAAAAVRPMIGVSPDAWREAREALGEVEAHVVVAAILQRSIHSSEARTSPDAGPGGEMLVNGSPAIRSAGGYLRALSEQARAGTFALGPVLMALIGQRLKVKRAGAQSGMQAGMHAARGAERLPSGGGAA
jgi:replication initiation protein RepC